MPSEPGIFRRGQQESPLILPVRVVIASLLLMFGGCYAPPPSADLIQGAPTPPDLPPLPPGPSLNVLVFGDHGTGDQGQVMVATSMAAAHGKAPPSLVLTVGDNFYPDGVESVEDPLWKENFEEVYSGPFWDGLVFHPTLGNHDYHGNLQAQIQYSRLSSRWHMPGRFYAFQRALPSGDSVLFMALDTEGVTDDPQAAGAQAAWADSVLDANPDRWMLAYGHHPLATVGRHGPEAAVRDLLLPLFDGRVPLYLSGHNHSTELLPVNETLLQGVCGGGAARDNAYRVDPTEETLFAYTNGGWCYLRIWPGVMAVELYDRTGTLRYRHLLQKPE